MKPDYGRRVTTESFQNGLPQHKTVELVDHMATSHKELVTDVIKCLTLLKERTTPELTITIHMDKYGQPIRITRIFTESKESLK